MAEQMELGRYLLGFVPTGEPDTGREPDLQPLSDFRASLAYLKSLNDGACHFWVGRRKGFGRGEGSSGLKFDSLEGKRLIIRCIPSATSEPRARRVAAEATLQD
jgi:hypothetical protein